MLDRLFLSRMNGRGKIAYFVGQLLVIALVFIGLLSSGTDIDDDSFFLMLVLIVLPTIIVWGVVCVRLWPVETAADRIELTGDVGAKPLPPAPSEPFRAECSCGAYLNAEPKHFGKKRKCPDCGELVRLLPKR